QPARTLAVTRITGYKGVADPYQLGTLRRRSGVPPGRLRARGAEYPRVAALRLVVETELRSRDAGRRARTVRQLSTLGNPCTRAQRPPMPSAGVLMCDRTSAKTVCIRSYAPR